MAFIAPFRGLRYNPEVIADLDRVVIPPYDVISPAEQEYFHRKDPRNFIRIELGEATPQDGPEDNPHTRAAACLSRWESERVLAREAAPAIYYYELDFKNGPASPMTTRYGFVCALRLEDFATRGVRPHEKTFQAVKDERLALMQACNANLSPVFALYSDPMRAVDAALRAAHEPRPLAAFTDENGMVHRVWRVMDPDALKTARDLMTDKAIFIADGHHRYETALNYRNIQRKLHPSASPRASFEYVMMYLTNLNQGGLTILPTHRMLRNLGAWDPRAFIASARLFFDVKQYEPNGKGHSGWMRAIAEEGERKETAIGFYCREAGCIYVLTARREAVSSFLAEQGLAEQLRTLDVVVLDQVILRNLLGLSEAFLGDGRNISFMHDFAQAFDSIGSGKFDAGFFINYTRIEQVQEVASAGLIMPHKSTYFYPKVISGLVINPLSANEEIIW